MRYGKILSGMWSDQRFQALGCGAKLLYVYLLSCEHCSSIGLFKLGMGYVMDDMDVSRKEAESAMAELEGQGLASYDKGTKTCLIHRYLRYNPPQNPKHLKGMAKVFDEQEATEYDEAFLKEADEVCVSLGYGAFSSLVHRMADRSDTLSHTVSDTVSDRVSDRVSDTVSIPETETETETESSEQEQKQEQKKEKRKEYSHSFVLQKTEETPRPAETGSEQEVDRIPLVDGSEYQVTEAWAEAQRKAYPAVDVVAEVHKMRSWCVANKTNRKTRKGVERFMVNWLGRAQDRAGRAVTRGQSAIPDSAVHTSQYYGGENMEVPV